MSAGQPEVPHSDGSVTRCLAADRSLVGIAATSSSAWIQPSVSHLTDRRRRLVHSGGVRRCRMASSISSASTAATMPAWRTQPWLAGAIAGLVGGVVLGVMMALMTAPTPDGGSMPMMGMVAMVVRSDSLLVGWIYHLFNSAVIGAIFGWLLGRRISGYASGAGWGALYGLVWWVLGGLILMPVLLGMPVFAPLMMAMMVPVAIGSLVGHLMFGVLTGVAYRGIVAQ